ncbi:MAG: hypothetical protein DI534_14370 [Leifsonia xyli]|nr:MAG: hypothetical protein DI534_14370 [Leifsonia xyli]
MAYTTTGCKWESTSPTIDHRYVNGNFRTALTSARGNYNGSTDVTLSATGSLGPSFTATNSNYGADGEEGYTTWSCFFGTTTAANVTLNQ